MAFNITDLLTNFLLPGIKTTATAGLYEVLEDLYAKNPEAHKTVVTSVYRPFAAHLKPLVTGTKTKLDDTAVDVVLEAIQASAAAHDIILPE